MHSRGDPLPAAVAHRAAAALLTTLVPALIALGTAACGVPAGAPVGGPTATWSPATRVPGSPGALGTPGSASPAAAAPAITITVRVGAGRASTTGRRFVVRRGDTVRVIITTDRADEFHLHGYDRTAALRPGPATTIELVAGLPGVFEAELHESGTRLFELQVG